MEVLLSELPESKLLLLFELLLQAKNSTVDIETKPKAKYFLVFFIFQMQVTRRTFLAIFSRFGKWIVDESGGATTLGMAIKSTIFTVIYLAIYWILNNM